MDLKGRIIKIMDTEEISERFSKREFVLETAENPEYPQELLLQCTQKKVSLLDKFNAGDIVTVSVNLRGHRYSGKNGDRWFNSLEAWKLHKKQGADSYVDDDCMPF